MPRYITYRTSQLPVEITDTAEVEEVRLYRDPQTNLTTLELIVKIDTATSPKRPFHSVVLKFSALCEVE